MQFEVDTTIMVVDVEPLFIYLLNKPQVLTLAIAILIGLSYYFGNLLSLNNWQSNNLTKQSYLFIGIGFLAGYVVFPLLLYYFIFHFFYNSDIFSFLLLSGLFFSLVLMDKVLYHNIRIIADNFVNFKENNGKIRFGHSYYEMFDNKVLNVIGNIYGGLFTNIIILFLLNVLIYNITKNSILIIGMIWLDFLILTKTAILSNLNYQGSIAEIKFIGSDDSKTFRLIEFIEKGNFLKVQDKETKKVLVIPTSRIEAIHLFDEMK